LHGVILLHVGLFAEANIYKWQTRVILLHVDLAEANI